MGEVMDESVLLLIADDPALDLLNTTPRVNGEIVDFFQSDEDVVRWLVATGFAGAHGGPVSGLLVAARGLREAFRKLVVRRKAGERGDLTALNVYLAEAQSSPRLAWDRSKALVMTRVREERTAMQRLARVAEAAADLLVSGNFELVRQCEDESCVLWFYDRTKSHHRRWCSMATCGNRNKVAAYRKRRGA
jgi:predicted RNA-binding Zn ribbon-like protein